MLEGKNTTNNTTNNTTKKATYKDHNKLIVRHMRLQGGLEALPRTTHILQIDNEDGDHSLRPELNLHVAL